MSNYPPEIVKVVTLDPITGDEIDSYYGVAYSTDEGYAITRSTETLEELRQVVGGDLTDEHALLTHLSEHHPDFAI